MPVRNNNPRGIALILLGMALFSIQDALIKFIYKDSALYELYFGRTLTASVLLISYLLISKKKNFIKDTLSLFNNIKSCFIFLWL